MVRTTITINAKVCESYPQVVTACLESGWDLTAHGYEHIPMHRLDNQSESIARAIRYPGSWYAKVSASGVIRNVSLGRKCFTRIARG